MIKTIVVDDENLVRQGIIYLLKKYYYIELVAEAASVKEAAALINKHKPDLVLLDIQLKDGTGFDLLKKLNHIPQIIFVTAFNTYAIQAIKVGALDYILKPLDERELAIAIKKLQESKENQAPEQFLEAAKYYTGKKEKMVLRNAEGIHMVRFEDIMYCVGDGGYTYFKLKEDKTIVVSKSIGEYENILKDHFIMRCHQSYLVNTNEVIKMTKQNNLLLHNGASIPVSVRRKEAVLAALL